MREHRGSAWKYAGAAILTGLMTVLGIYALSVMDPPDPGKAGAFIALLGVIAIVFAFTAVRDAKSALFIHERGIAYRRGSGTTKVRFSEIASVHEQRFNGKASSLILKLRDGTQVSIRTTMHAYEHAAQTIANAVG